MCFYILFLNPQRACARVVCHDLVLEKAPFLGLKLMLFDMPFLTIS